MASSSFQQQVDLVYEGKQTEWIGAKNLYGEMTDSERLSILYGDLTWLPFLYEIFVYGPNYTPSPAGIIPRLGIPGILFSDGPRGVVMGHSTAFPTTSTRGCTWNPKLEEEIVCVLAVSMDNQN